MSEKVPPLLPRDDGLLYAEDLTPEQVLASIDQFSEKHKPCSICDSVHWLIQQDSSGKPILTHMPSFRNEDDKVITLFMYCATCGHIRAFMAETITRLARNLR